MHIEVIGRRTRIRKREIWYSRIVASNNKILYTSEKYQNVEDCVNVAHLVSHTNLRVLPPKILGS